MFLQKTFAVIFAVTMISLSGVSVSGLAWAETETKIPPPIEAEKMKQMEKVNPYYPKLDKKEREIGTGLQEPELTHLYHIREGFGQIQAVSIVRRDVDTAVKACAKDNPDLKSDIEKRFSEWKNTVNPVIDEKQAAIDKAINEQTYTKSKDIKEYLKLFKDTAEYANKALDKGEINTSEEACKNLMKSMDRTEKVVAELLGDIEILPWPPVPEKSNWSPAKVAN